MYFQLHFFEDLELLGIEDDQGRARYECKQLLLLINYFEDEGFPTQFLLDLNFPLLPHLSSLIGDQLNAPLIKKEQTFIVQRLNMDYVVVGGVEGSALQIRAQVWEAFEAKRGKRIFVLEPVYLLWLGSDFDFEVLRALVHGQLVETQHCLSQE